jgi:hypothetical protein
MPTVNRCWLVLALAAVHAASAAVPRANSHPEYQSPAWTVKAIPVLTARADANSLATAAALSATGSAQTALDLAARANDLAPQSAAIGWLHLQLCIRSQACAVRDIATNMRWVDPDNGAAWLPTLATAQRDRDTTEVDRILGDMARNPRFDLYWNRLVVLMFDALGAARSALPGASDSSRYAAVTGIAKGEIIPAFAPLVDACRESVSLPERRDLCLKISKPLQRGDTIAAQLAGFTIERRLLAPDSKEARAIAERRHVLEWRVAAAAKLDIALLPWTKNARARARVAQMRTMPREEDVCIAILRKHKMALEPPEVHP